MGPRWDEKIPWRVEDREGLQADAMQEVKLTNGSCNSEQGDLPACEPTVVVHLPRHGESSRHHPAVTNRQGEQTLTASTTDMTACLQYRRAWLARLSPNARRSFRLASQNHRSQRSCLRGQAFHLDLLLLREDPSCRHLQLLRLPC